jgi:hypothetical protein
MLRVLAVAFAAAVSAAAFTPAYAGDAGQSVIEPVRMCFDKFCDARGKCTYRPKPCPRSTPAQ